MLHVDWLFCSRFITFKFDLLDQQELWTDYYHQYGISVILLQTSLPWNIPSGEEQQKTAVFTGWF